MWLGSKRWVLGMGFGLVAALGLAGCGGGSDSDGTSTAQQASNVATALERVEPMTRSVAKSLEATSLKARPAWSPAARAIALGEVSQAKLASEVPLLTLNGAPRKIGFGRDIAQAASTAGTAARLDWQTRADGRRAAALSITSSQAMAVRLGVLVRSLPETATLRVYAQGATVAYETSGAEILATLQRNQAAGDTSDAARTYWAPAVDGAEATLEIELPAGIDPAKVEIAVPRLSHLFAAPASDPAASTVNLAKIGEAARCEIDVSCTSGYTSESNAVAKMNFVEGNATYQCSGTLLNDRAGSGTPYFLSANHCVSTQAVASTLQTFWFYRSASCNALVLDPAYKTLAGGAVLLYASTNTDTSFMRLNSLPPAGAVYAGWSVTPPAVSTSVFGLHFPEGDLQKISTGRVSSFQNCTPLSDGTESFSCSAGSQSTGNFLDTLFTSGSTESGSSGSPLFQTVGSTRYVVGQLYGGTASCRNTGGSNIYGRFDVAYNASLKQWLATSSARSPVYRFYNATTQAHFFTISAAERDFVIANNKQFAYEASVFYAYTTAGAGLSPVYRFYNATSGAHFYTIDQAERDFVIQNYKQFAYEGPVWYAQTGDGNGATALYRFFRSTNSAHFYSASAAERDYVRANLPEYSYEGVAYYIWSAP